VVCHILLKRSQWGLQLCLRSHLNQRYAHKVMGPQSCGSSNLWKFGTPTWESWDIMTFGCWHVWLGIENTIRGKVVISPKSRPWWVLRVCVCLWLIRAPKVIQLCTTTLLFGLYRYVWIIDLFVTRFSSISKLQQAPLPPKCYELKNILDSFSFRCFHL
jgi:hypothetical protein